MTQKTNNQDHTGSKRLLDKKLRELNTIFDISSEFNVELNKEKIIDLLIYSIMGEMMVSNILYYEFHGNTISVKTIKGLILTDELEIQLNSQDITEMLQSIDTIQPVENNNNQFNELSEKHSIQIKLLIPLSRGKNRIGVLALGSKINQQEYAIDEIEFLSILTNQAVGAIENSRLFKESIEKQKIEKELMIAQEIQNKLFPQKNPETISYQIRGKNIPSLQVGGDYYDFIYIDSNRIAFIIADVSGKGVAASLIMSNLQAILRGLIEYDKDLITLMKKMNDFIYQRTTIDKYITLFLGIIDTEKHTLEYINGGHNPPYLVKKDKSIKELHTGGTIIGMFPFYTCEKETIHLNQEDLIFLYTDGVTEAMDSSSEEFGEERLLKFLKLHSHKNADEIENNLFEEINKFTGNAPQSDDITMIIIKRE